MRKFYQIPRDLSKRRGPASTGIRIVLRQALFRSSFTAARIWRFAVPIDPLIVHPAALRCPPPPNLDASTVASQSPRVRMEQRVSLVRSGIW